MTYDVIKYDHRNLKRETDDTMIYCTFVPSHFEWRLDVIEIREFEAGYGSNNQVVTLKTMVVTEYTIAVPSITARCNASQTSLVTRPTTTFSHARERMEQII